MSDPLAQTLTLPCGAVLNNRLAKAAMTEGLSDPRLRATARHEHLYRQWSEGGAGLLLTGNVQIDRRVLERPGNVAVDVTAGGDAPEARAALRRWATAGTTGGNHLWMQIAHAGWQSPRYVSWQPLAPSDVPLQLLGNYGRPRAMREDEILDFIGRFARVAAIARECGFTGVQIHSAHGYLLSSFLSPYTNRRTDAWGGSLENRARFLLEILKAVRAAAGADFPVSVKLNSDDFRKGGFSHDDCLNVVEWLNDASVDLLEISGGTYEQPRLLGATGRADSAVPVRQSTRQREAYFLEYALSIRRVAKMPLMLTGGFRSRAGMEEALRENACDVIGLGRPLCTQPDFPKRLLRGDVSEGPCHERTLVLSRRRWLSPASPILLFKVINVLGGQAWYYEQLFRLADRRPLRLSMGVLESFLRYWWSELSTAWRMHRARRAS
jgi:2,4-dienoyl-CoA reductase-like NADH-dependent reductase (Old Yellow Enzyme family)